MNPLKRVQESTLEKLCGQSIELERKRKALKWIYDLSKGLKENNFFSASPFEILDKIHQIAKEEVERGSFQ